MRGNLVRFLKFFYKLTGIIKSCLGSNIRNRIICMQQQRFGFLQTIIIQVRRCRFPCILLKQFHEIKFTVKGYGHGVGMSQTGADSMAKQGSNYEEIIKHYYTRVEITNL